MLIKKRPLSRRHFLRCGAGGLGAIVTLPALEAMFGTDRAYAQSASGPARFLAIYQPNGHRAQSVAPDFSEDRLRSPDLTGYNTEALQRHMDVTTIFKNFNSTKAGGRGNAHLNAITSWLRGTHPVDASDLTMRRFTLNEDDRSSADVVIARRYEQAYPLPGGRSQHLVIRGSAFYDGGNSGNVTTPMTVRMDSGAVRLDVPRDRNGTFEPKLVPKGQRRLKGFDDKVISLYARGLTVREIRGQLEEIYNVEVSPDLISRITDQVLGEVREWQGRPLEPMYPIVYLDGFVVKVRHEGVTRNRTIHIALAIDISGQKRVLGLWVAANEGAKFWLSVMNELRQRGLEDILIASVDGLRGFPEAIEAAFPNTIVQTCIVHMVRSSTLMVSWSIL